MIQKKEYCSVVITNKQKADFGKVKFWPSAEPTILLIWNTENMYSRRLVECCLIYFTSLFKLYVFIFLKNFIFMWEKKHLFSRHSKLSYKCHFILDIPPPSSCRFYILVENNKWWYILKNQCWWVPTSNQKMGISSERFQTY